MPFARIVALFAVLLAPFSLAAAGDAKLRVAASFSILGDMAAQVGGERVVVTTLVGRGGDAHIFEPSPADALALREAKVAIVNGLGFDAWMDRLIASSGFAGARIVASEGSTLLDLHDDHAGEGDHAHHHDGAHDPHAWQNPANAIAYVRAIAAGLAQADPAGAAIYQANAEAYIARIAALDAELKASFGALSAEDKRVIVSHDAFRYFGAAYGVSFLAATGVSTEAQPSARSVAELIRKARAEGVKAIFVETIADPRLAEQIARETGAKMGGALYSDSLSPPDGPAATYLDMIAWNARRLLAALTPA